MIKLRFDQWEAALYYLALAEAEAEAEGEDPDEAPMEPTLL